MAKPYSMDLRERVASALMGGQRREAVARRFEISLSSVGRYIRRFRETGTLAPDKFGGHKRHALVDEEERLRDWIKERPDMTLVEIKERLHESGIEVGQTAISNFLRHLGLSYKKKTLHAAEQEREDVKEAREVAARVEAWRDNDRLPFPEFDPGLRWEMEDILDYPPKGAYNYKHRKGLSEGPPPDSETKSPAEPEKKGRRLGFRARKG